MADQKTSLLINRQVPEFVRDEYPVFVSFLEAYYEFLEQKQGTELNDLVAKSKDLRDISDVDLSIEDFEQNFFNNFANLIPRDIAVDKSVLIKNVLPLYLSKGSESSFKLLYRMLFGDELEVKYPKNDVLRASDGKWQIENALKVSKDFYSYYTGNGTKTEFKLLQELNQDDITVYIDDVAQTSGYYVRKESKKLVFDTAPLLNSTVKVLYSILDKTFFTNRKITGELSGTTALVEKVSNQIINEELVIQFYINDKTLIGNFINGENVLTDIIVDGILVNVIAETVSNILSINIIDGGSNYNVGDPVIVNAPVAEVGPSALISKTFKGVINQVTIHDGGAGFTVGERIAAVGYEQSQLNFAIANVDLSGANTANVFKIYSDVISDVDPANTILTATNWHFPGNIAPSHTINVNSVISTAFSNVTYVGIGEISNVTIAAANVVVTSTPILNAAPAYVTISPLTANTPSSTIVTIDTFGSLGKLVIRQSGTGYAVGDELIFTNKPMSFGTGAAAVVKSVSTIGRILDVEFVPSRITGTANVTSVSNVMVQGTGTTFLSDLVPGDDIMIGFDTRKVLTIASDTSLNVSSASWSTISIGQPIRKHGKNLIGGQGYTQDKLPTVTISTTGGTGASIEVTAIMGDGEDLVPKGTKRPGEIEEIIITNPGKAIKVLPTVDLVNYGDGTALANVTLNPSYETFEGRWSTSDGILSSVDRRLQGRDYYVNYSYLLSSATEFSKYKKIFKELLHPSGFKMYSELIRLDELDSNTVTLETITAPKNIKSLSGRVNVANTSIYVTGEGTKFNVANSLGIISIGAYIAVNNQIRVVDSIISNTNLAVTSAFTISANNEELLVVNTVYNAVATEITLDEIIAENEITLTVES
jgi:hypothetical protein